MHRARVSLESPPRNRLAPATLVAPVGRFALPRPRLGSRISRWLADTLLVLGFLAVAGPAAAAEGSRWVTVAGKSWVAFEASFPLGDFTGRTQDAAGDFHADP